LTLHDVATLKGFLRRHGLTAEKGLGQHFLVSASAVESIVGALDGCQGACEIGPGPGVLTGPVSERVQRLIALEVDAPMQLLLAESAPKAEVRLEDALKVDLAAVLDELPTPRAIVSNMPYYITAPLLQRVADVRSHIDRAVLMMQKEVAQRVMAKPGNRDRGSLSVFLQTHFEIFLVAQVPAGSFFPPPKVDSTVLKFVPRTFDLTEGEAAQYFRLIRFGFSQPRKTLANNLAAGLHVPRDRVVPAIEAVGLDDLIRPQELTLEHWRALSRALASE